MNVYNLFADENSPEQQPSFEPRGYQAPEIPTLQEQANTALGLDGIQPDFNQPVTVQPTRAEQVQKYLEEAKQYGYNPFAKLIDESVPKFDEAAANRTQNAAKWSAIGNAIQALYGGAIAKRGGPVFAVDNTYPIEATNRYRQMVAEDKQNQYRANLMKMNLLQNVTSTALKNANAAEIAQAKYLHDDYWKNRAFEQKEREIKASAQRNGGQLTFEQQKELINLRANRNADLIQKRNNALIFITNLKANNQLSYADYKAALDAINAQYENNKTTTETETYSSDGKTTKRTTQLNGEPPVFKSHVSTSSTPQGRTTTVGGDEFEQYKRK